MKTKLILLVCLTLGLMSSCEGKKDEPQSSDANGHDWVDLGLSVKWATCNVGATTPYAMGDYFAWGETAPKDIYTVDNYTYSENPTQLSLANDAAHVIWGGDWRMPTKEEYRELLLNTKITLEDTYTVRLTAANGNYILMPLAGFAKENGTLKNVGDCGYYWTSLLNEENSEQAVDVIFEELFIGAHALGFYGGNRFCGLSIRPVLP